MFNIKIFCLMKKILFIICSVCAFIFTSCHYRCSKSLFDYVPKSYFSQYFPVEGTEVKYHNNAFDTITFITEKPSLIWYDDIENNGANTFENAMGMMDYRMSNVDNVLYFNISITGYLHTKEQITSCQYTCHINDSIYIDYCDSLYCHPTELVQKCLGDNIVILSNNGDLVFEIRQNVGVVKFFNKNEYWYLVE